MFNEKPSAKVRKTAQKSPRAEGRGKMADVPYVILCEFFDYYCVIVNKIVTFARK